MKSHTESHTSNAAPLLSATTPLLANEQLGGDLDFGATLYEIKLDGGATTSMERWWRSVERVVGLEETWTVRLCWPASVSRSVASQRSRADYVAHRCPRTLQSTSTVLQLWVHEQKRCIYSFKRLHQRSGFPRRKLKAL